MMVGLAQYIRSYESNDRIIADPSEPLLKRIDVIGDMLSRAITYNKRCDYLFILHGLIAEAEQS